MISLSSLLFQTCICISVNLSEGPHCSLRGAHPPKSSPTHFSSHRHELNFLQTTACTGNNASSNCFIRDSPRSLVVLTGAWSLQIATCWVKCWWDRLEKYGTDSCENVNSVSQAAKKWQDQTVQPALERYKPKVTAGIGITPACTGPSIPQTPSKLRSSLHSLPDVQDNVHEPKRQLCAVSAYCILRERMNPM